MKDILTEWIQPLLWGLAFLTAGGGLAIYLTQVCPGVKAHTVLTKLLCPHFILDEFKKTRQKTGASLWPYHAFRFCFAAPLVFIILALFCAKAK